MYRTIRLFDFSDFEYNVEVLIDYNYSNISLKLILVLQFIKEAVIARISRIQCEYVCTLLIASIKYSHSTCRSISESNERHGTMKQSCRRTACELQSR